MVEKPEESAKKDESAAQQPAAQGAQAGTGQQVILTVDERNMKISYANAFRANGTAEEVMLDLGVETIYPAQTGETQPRVVFQVNDRVILNFYTAKRLAIALGQMIRRHEDQFGELQLEVAKRRKTA